MSTDDDMRDFTRRLFGRKPSSEPPEPEAANRVPEEGRQVERSADDEHDMREFTGVLFGRTSTIHEIH